MRSRYYRIAAAVWLCASACGNVQKPDGESAGLLPADSLAVHFWNEPSVLREPLDSVAAEQHFADFLGLLLNAGADTRARAVEALMHGARQQELIEHYADHYLFDPNSPLRDDGLYIVFARGMLENYRLDDAARMVLEAKIENAAKNMPGTRAADFAYVTRSGDRATLHTTAPGRELLLLFYEPDCSNCAAAIERLAADAGIAHRTDAGTLAVLAVYPDDDTALWQSTAASLPEGWTVARAADPDLIADLYYIAATPSVYLLDADRRVLAKDISP